MQTLSKGVTQCHNISGSGKCVSWEREIPYLDRVGQVEVMSEQTSELSDAKTRASLTKGSKDQGGASLPCFRGKGWQAQKSKERKAGNQVPAGPESLLYVTKSLDVIYNSLKETFGVK